MPVVVVTGARQTGKSTLANVLASDPERLYVTLDDVDVQDQARNAPEELVNRANRMTLDEVQRSPDLAPGGLVLYDGEETFWIAKNILATPWWRVV